MPAPAQAPLTNILGQFLLIVVVTVALGSVVGVVMQRLDWVWGRIAMTMILAVVVGALAGAIITNYFP